MVRVSTDHLIFFTTKALSTQGRLHKSSLLLWLGHRLFFATEARSPRKTMFYFQFLLSFRHGPCLHEPFSFFYHQGTKYTRQVTQIFLASVARPSFVFCHGSTEPTENYALFPIPSFPSAMVRVSTDHLIFFTTKALSTQGRLIQIFRVSVANLVN
jgi:4-amino-4-deoxy-L-arabinose transferase-like glycosyltransferase